MTDLTDIPELEAQAWMDRLGLGFKVVIKEALWANRFLEGQND